VFLVSLHVSFHVYGCYVSLSVIKTKGKIFARLLVFSFPSAENFHDQSYVFFEGLLLDTISGPLI
jgi:hypothetical protein